MKISEIRGTVEELKGVIRSSFAIHMQLLVENSIDVHNHFDLLDVTELFQNNRFVLFRNGQVHILLNARCFIPIMLSE